MGALRAPPAPLGLLVRIRCRRGLLAVAMAVLSGAAAASVYVFWRANHGHAVETCSERAQAGRRWSLALDAISSVKFDSNRIVISGQRLHAGVGEWWFETAVVEHAFPLTVMPDNQWVLEDSRYTESESEVRVRRRSDGKSICVLLPRGAARPLIASGRSPRGEMIAVVAGDWKIGPESYLAILNVDMTRELPLLGK